MRPVSLEGFTACRRWGRRGSSCEVLPWLPKPAVSCATFSKLDPGNESTLSQRPSLFLGKRAVFKIFCRLVLLPRIDQNKHHLPRGSSAWELVSTIWLIKLGGFRFLKRWSPFVETYDSALFFATCSYWLKHCSERWSSCTARTQNIPRFGFALHPTPTMSTLLGAGPLQDDSAHSACVLLWRWGANRREAEASAWAPAFLRHTGPYPSVFWRRSGGCARYSKHTTAQQIVYPFFTLFLRKKEICATIAHRAFPQTVSYRWSAIQEIYAWWLKLEMSPTWGTLPKPDSRGAWDTWIYLVLLTKHLYAGNAAPIDPDCAAAKSFTHRSQCHFVGAKPTAYLPGFSCNPDRDDRKATKLGSLKWVAVKNGAFNWPGRLGRGVVLSCFLHFCHEKIV